MEQEKKFLQEKHIQFEKKVASLKNWEAQLNAREKNVQIHNKEENTSIISREKQLKH